MTITISKWGNSLAVRLPKEALESAHLHEGDLLSVVAAENGLLLTPVNRPSIEALVDAITAENLHRETRTGLPVGNEVW